MTARKEKPPAEAPRAADLLAWYDRHRRRLPWRALPGEAADPYRVWLSEVMLQQTTVKAVAPYFDRFLSRWPKVEDLAAAPLEDVMREWAGLGYYARARNMHKAAVAVAEGCGGRFPESETALRALPGIGDYTAAAVAAIAFDRKATVVDGNVERVVARIFAVEEPLPKAKPKLKALAGRLTPERRAGDFAQGMMDLGATICTPRKPACALCPWNGNCAARATGAPETYPMRTAKAERPVRHGAAFVALRPDGTILLRDRPPRGLLGGMAEVPTSEWSARPAGAEAAPFAAEWKAIPGLVEHTFTHFRLRLAVFAAEVEPACAAPGGGRWVPRSALSREALPSVMRKVVAHALEMPARPG